MKHFKLLIAGICAIVGAGLMQPLFNGFRYRIWLGVLLGLSSIAFNGCTTTTASGAVGASRSQFMLISSDKMNQIAEQSYLQLKTEANKKGTLNADHTMLARVREIAKRIEPQTAVFRDDAPAWNWEINIIASKELNAFCMPGGKIIFYSGLIEKLKLTDDEIAVVMGHEIAHALREHSREKLSQSLAAQTAIDLGTALLGFGTASSDLANLGYKNFVATKFSRTDESEADSIGLELAARAGYDPRAGVALWKSMAAQSNSHSPEILSTHPADSNRIEQIEGLLPAVVPLYDAAKKNMPDKSH